jgi:hypothetical protein
MIKYPYECRLRAAEIRHEQLAGRRCLRGYAAIYNVLSDDLGGWRERIMPGAFTRALEENQDVRHLVNHNVNLVLGRTKTGTTTLRQDAKGLAFETWLGNRTYDLDLAESVGRGDVDAMSFGFVARRENWTAERVPDSEERIEVRELCDLDLFDISTVTYPAYPATSAGIDSRALFPYGPPLELRRRLAAASFQGLQLPEGLAPDSKHLDQSQRWRACALRRLRIAVEFTN